MTIKDETTAMVRTLSTLSPAEYARFLTETIKRFQAILADHTRGPLDDPEHPEAPVDPSVDPRNIYLTVLLLDKDTLLAHLDGKFAQFINSKWFMAMDVFVKLLPLEAPAQELREALGAISLTQMLAGDTLFPATYADDAALLARTLTDMAQSPERKLVYLTQFAQTLV